MPGELIVSRFIAPGGRNVLLRKESAVASQSFFSPRALSADAADAQEQLYRYPDISDRELAVLVRHFQNLPLLDFGLLAADERLGAKMDVFFADHGDKLRPPLSWTEWAIAAAAVIGIFSWVYVNLG